MARKKISVKADGGGKKKKKLVKRKGKPSTTPQGRHGAPPPSAHSPAVTHGQKVAVGSTVSVGDYAVTRYALGTFTCTCLNYKANAGLNHGARRAPFRSKHLPNTPLN